MPGDLDLPALLAAPDDDARLVLLDESGLGAPVDLDALLDRAQSLIHDEPGSAELLVRLADRLGARDEVPAVGARASYLLAQIRADQGELDQALELIARARTTYLDSGDRVQALRTDLGRMQVLDDLGRHTEALSLGRRLIEAVADTEPGTADDLGLGRIRAVALDNLGAALGYLGENEAALDSYAQADREYRRLGLIAESARPLANRGVELLALGRAREAQQVLAEASAAFKAAGDRLFAAKCDSFRAQAHTQLGELTEALAVLQHAHSELVELQARTEADRAQLAIAETYLAVGLFTEARLTASELGKRTAAAGMRHDAAAARLIEGQAALALFDTAGAEIALADAEQAFAAVGDRQQQARVHLARAEAAAQSGDRAAAAELIERATGELTAGGWLVPLALARLRQADLAEHPDDIDRQLTAAGDLIGQLRLPHLAYQLAIRAARRARAHGDLRLAESLLTEAWSQVNRSSGALPDHALRTAYRADKAAAADDLVDLLVTRGAPDDLGRAIRVSDTSKAQTLQDLVSDSLGAGPDLTTGSPELAGAYADLNAAYLALQSVDEPGRRRLLHIRIDELEHQVGRLRIVPTAARPRSADAIAEHPPPTEPSVTILRLHLTGADVVALVSDGDRVTARRLAGAADALWRDLAALSGQWARFAMGPSFRDRHAAQLARTVRATLGSVHRTLIEPVADLLPEGGPLQVVPHRWLGQIPFAALFDGQRHLLERGPITLAPTRPTATAPAVRDLLDRALLIGCADEAAPRAETEIGRISQTVPTAAMLDGAAATSQAFFAQAPGRTLIHLACHGSYRDSNPLFSRLRLADRWITSAEVLRLRLSGALVVLSACESGRGDHRVESVGLSWAFLAAGATGVVASQWLVNDATTEQLMARFYVHLTTDPEPARALRAAQLELAAEHQHPYFWAPFSYVSSPAVATT